MRNTTKSQSRTSRMKILSVEEGNEAHEGMFWDSHGDICF